MKMKMEKRKPFLPTVTLEEVYAFDPARPETWTRSEFLNAVLEAMREVCPATTTNVAEYLAVDYKDLSGALRILTGYHYSSLRNHWILHEVEKLRAEGVKLENTEVARRLGFADRSSLWRFLNNKRLMSELENDLPRRGPKPCPERRTW